MTTDRPDNSKNRCPGGLPSGIDTSEWTDRRLARALDTVDAGPDGCGADSEFDDRTSRVLAAMAADRARLRSLENEPVPSGLLGAAIGAAFDDGLVLDGEVLACIESDSASDDELPVSSVVPERGGVIGWIGRYRAECGLALAAALTLLVGGPALIGVFERHEPVAVAVNKPEPGLDWSHVIIEGIPAVQTGAVEIAVADEPAGTERAPSPREALASFGERVGSVFEGEALMLDDRLLVVVRGSIGQVAEAIEPMMGYDVGSDHSFAIAGAMPMQTLGSLPLPEIGVPIMAMDRSNGTMRVELPERSGWIAQVRPTANGLASLIDALDGSGLSVEMRSIPESEFGRAPGRDASVRRTIDLPIIIEALP